VVLVGARVAVVEEAVDELLGAAAEECRRRRHCERRRCPEKAVTSQRKRASRKE
jgi:hypothetical protein